MNYDFSNYKFRCSSLGYIMGDIKGKTYQEQYDEAMANYKKYIAIATKTLNLDVNEKNLAKAADMKEELERLEPLIDTVQLSESCKTHLADIYTSVVYGRNEDVKSKYLEKGLQCEEDAITQYCIANNIFLKKNDKERENNYIRGHIDIEEEDFIVDTKVNWSIFQFNRVVSRPVKQLYKWQLKGYCILWGKEYGKLSYNLIDTPEHLIVQEEKKLLYSWVGSEEEYKAACAEIRFNHTYSDIPPEERIRTFIVELEDGDKEKIEERVIACRKYLNNFNNGTY